MKNEFKWAVIISVIMLAWLTILKFAGFESEKASQFSMVSMVFFVFMFGFYVLAVRERRTRLRGFIERRDAFLTGLIITMFLVLLMPINMLIFHFVINPDFFQTMIDVAVESGTPFEQAKSDYNLVAYIFSSMLMMAILGGLYSAVCAVLLQRVPNEIEKNESLA